MECKQEKNDNKQFVCARKLRGQTDIKKLINNKSPYDRSQHDIRSKVVYRHKCKKCQERAKNKDNREDLFIEKESTKHNQHTNHKKEKNTSKTIKPPETTEVKERTNKALFKTETIKKKEGNIILCGKTDDLYISNHTVVNNKMKYGKQLKVTFSDKSDTHSIKGNKKGSGKNYDRKKIIPNTLGFNHKRINFDSKLYIKEGKIQRLRTIGKQGETAVGHLQPDSSTFSARIKDSTKNIECYEEEMNITKHNNLQTYPIIDVTSVEKNINDTIDVYESGSILMVEKPEATEKLKCPSQQKKEEITKYKNSDEKEYLPGEKGRQIEDLLFKVRIQNEMQLVNFRETMKKSCFSNNLKDSGREETGKIPLLNQSTKKSGKATLNCDIYENSIGETTPGSLRSLSDSCLRLQKTMYKYKNRKNKVVSTKCSLKSLSNKKLPKLLQNKKEVIHNNKTPELNHRNRNKPHQPTNFSDSIKSASESENVGNESELETFNKKNTCSKYDSENSISGTLNKFDQAKRVCEEQQWCFPDPALYICDSKLILDDGQRTTSSSGPPHTLISQEKSNETWKSENIYKISISVSDVNSAVSLEDLNEKNSETNNTLEYSGGKDLEPSIKINIIQNEFNKMKLKLKENCYCINKNDTFKNNEIIHYNNNNVENNRRSKNTVPHQSAVTLISGFGSKSSGDDGKKSESDLTKLIDSSLNEIEMSLIIKKDAAVSASTSYDILRTTKFLTDKAIMCYDAVPLKLRKQRREKLKKIQQENQRESKQICGTVLEKQSDLYQDKYLARPDILNQGDNETVENSISQYRKYKAVNSEKRNQGRNMKHHNFSGKDITQLKEENETGPFRKREELENIKLKLQDNFSLVYNKENLKQRQSKGFWNSMRSGGRRLVRLLQDSASFKYCFRKNMFK